MGFMNWRTKSAEVLQQGGVIGPDERLPWPQTAVMGVQHVIAMFGATVLAPILMGFDPNVAILMSGVGTLIFFLITGGKVPSYLGSSFAFIGVVIAATSYAGKGANANGMVEYKAEFVMLKPKNMAKASGVLRYDAPNRGNILTMLNPTATPSDAVYLERGYVMLYSAWQGDVPKSTAARLTVTVPVARNKDGSSITGPYRAELVPTAASPAMTLPGGVFNGTMTPSTLAPRQRWPKLVCTV